MDNQDPKAAKKAFEQQIHAYTALSRLNKSEEFDIFFDLLLKTVADKMVWAFMGENIKDWAQFCDVRGELRSYLYGVQEVRSADAMKKHLKEKLDEYYQNPVG